MSFLKSLAAAFKGAETRVPLARNFSSPWAFADPHGTRPHFEYTGAVKRAYLDNPVAQRAVRLVSEGIGSAPLLQPVDPKLAALVTGTTEGQSLLETLAAQLLLHGNAFIQVIRNGAGKPVELYALRPDRMSVEQGADGWPVAWRYQVGQHTHVLQVEDEDGWPQVIHVRGFHPVDDHFGAGCLTAAAQAVAMMPVPSALVRMSASPGRAPPLDQMRSGSITPVTA